MTVSVFVRHSNKRSCVVVPNDSTLDAVLVAVGYPGGGLVWHFYSGGRKLPLSEPVVSGMELVLVHQMSEFKPVLVTS